MRFILEISKKKEQVFKFSVQSFFLKISNFKLIKKKIVVDKLSERKDIEDDVKDISFKKESDKEFSNLDF